MLPEKEDTTVAKQEKRIDTKRAPNKPRPYLMPIEWGGALPMTMSAKAKINKINTEGLKPPYLILCNHASFIDFPIVVRGDIPSPLLVGNIGRGICRKRLAYARRRRNI